MEDEMQPPDHEPGAIGSYTITHACTIEDEIIFHMKLEGINFNHGTAWMQGLPFEASAVVHSGGQQPEASGSYMVVEYDMMNRHCIIDIGYGLGRRMYMKWRIDQLASDKLYEWHA